MLTSIRCNKYRTPQFHSIVPFFFILISFSIWLHLWIEKRWRIFFSILFRIFSKFFRLKLKIKLVELNGKKISLRFWNIMQTRRWVNRSFSSLRHPNVRFPIKWLKIRMLVLSLKSRVLGGFEMVERHRSRTYNYPENFLVPYPVRREFAELRGLPFNSLHLTCAVWSEEPS